MKSTSYVGFERRTPFGTLAVIAADDIVVSSGFISLASAKARLGQVRLAKGALPWVADAVEAYLDGEFLPMMKIRVAQPGGDFAQAAWKAMRSVKAGRVVSYAELAERAGSPAAVRAAGTACARNWVAPFVPCHRVIRTGGELGQYGYGVAVKSALLRHEGFLSN